MVPLHRSCAHFLFDSHLASLFSNMTAGSFFWLSSRETFAHQMKMSLPRFDRVPKAELYSNKIKRGLSMGKVQKVYTREFKQEAVRLAQTSGKPIAQVARELGISDTSIHQ